MNSDRPDDRTFIRRSLIVAVVILGVGIAGWLIGQMSQVIFMVFVALFVAVAFEPPVHFLAKRGWRRGYATGAVFVVALLAGIGLLGILAPVFIEQIEVLINSIPVIVDSFVGFLESIGLDLSEIDPEEVGDSIVASVQALAPTLVGGILGLTASVFGFLFFVTTVALFAFYMIAELPQLQRTVLSTMPEPQQRRTLHIWDVSVEKMGGYIYSRMILAALSALVATVFLGILDVRFALALGVFVGLVSQFIPVVGTYIAAILPALVALTFNDWQTAMWVVIWFVAYQQIENYVIAPRITKRTMEIHPAVSVAAIIIGGTLLGAIGILLALPMTGIIQAMISESRKHHEVILDDETVEQDDADLSPA